MAEDTSTQDGNNDTAGDTSAGGDEVITLTPKQLSERLARAKPSDYDELKAKAEQFDALEAANKSEIEKANDKAAQAQRDAEAAQAEALRWRVAAKHGISDEDTELFLTGTDEDTLTKQAERLTARDSDRKKQGNYVPNEGTTTGSPSEDEVATFTRELFESARAQ